MHIAFIIIFTSTANCWYFITYGYFISEKRLAFALYLTHPCSRFYYFRTQYVLLVVSDFVLFSLRKLVNLGTLGLCNNRLTSLSLYSILGSINTESLLHLDLSENNLHGEGADALALYFMERHSLVYLDISKCQLHALELAAFFTALSYKDSPLQDLNISYNKLDTLTVASIAEYCMQTTCVLETLDLSWNDVGVQGAAMIATALASNYTIKKLDLSACGLTDIGGQHIASALGVNSTLTDLNLSHNSIMSSSCFVFAKVSLVNVHTSPK
jgi:Ran GTPase-activating protein (RanGAP) involved in mRNA processing and transport